MIATLPLETLAQQLQARRQLELQSIARIRTEIEATELQLAQINSRSFERLLRIQLDDARADLAAAQENLKAIDRVLSLVE